MFRIIEDGALGQDKVSSGNGKTKVGGILGAIRGDNVHRECAQARAMEFGGIRGVDLCNMSDGCTNSHSTCAVCTACF